MIQAARLLKPEAIRTCLGAVTAAAPDLAVSVSLGNRILGTPGGEALADGGPGVASEPLVLDGEAVGAVRVGGTAASDQAPAVAAGLAAMLQALLAAEHARRAVTAEALEAYREMALLHRAAVDLNGSLDPGEVARLLLNEFTGRSRSRCGAVFLFDEETAAPSLVACLPADGRDRLLRFAATHTFAAALRSEVAGIVNEIAHHPAAAVDDAAFGCLLTVPLRAHDKTLGLIVLLDQAEFPAADLKRAEALASIAATSLRNAQLFADQKQLFSALVEMVAHAIDAKSAYTSGHCRRVPVLARMLAEAAAAVAEGPLAGFGLDDEEWEALDIAAALHDCGKIVTPEWVMDKATKLQTIHDRMTEVAARFAVLQRDLDLASARSEIPAARAAAEKAALAEDLAFLRTCNLGSESMSPERIVRVTEIAGRRWRDADGADHPLLTADEVRNLCIVRGTLLPDERKIIEDHAALSRDMLRKLPFKGALRAVPEIAGNHHERLDGTGYPDGIGEERLSIQARILAIADVFEALTAPDRPYRRGASVSRAVAIMGQMVETNHLDRDLFRLMVDTGIHLDYARAHVAPEQLDCE